MKKILFLAIAVAYFAGVADITFAAQDWNSSRSNKTSKTSGVVNPAPMPGIPENRKNCFCTMEYKPVCGQFAAGKKTYNNKCALECAGATFVSEGECQFSEREKKMQKMLAELKEKQKEEMREHEGTDGDGLSDGDEKIMQGGHDGNGTAGIAIKNEGVKEKKIKVEGVERMGNDAGDQDKICYDDNGKMIPCVMFAHKKDIDREREFDGVEKAAQWDGPRAIGGRPKPADTVKGNGGPDKICYDENGEDIIPCPKIILNQKEDKGFKAGKMLKDPVHLKREDVEAGERMGVEVRQGMGLRKDENDENNFGDVEEKIGGNDPIEGIDVIVKLDPSGDKPIMDEEGNELDGSIEAIVKRATKEKKNVWAKPSEKELKVIAVKGKDAEVEAVKMNEDNTLSIKAKQKAALFGFIPMSVEVEARMDTKGVVKEVKKPWYAFLLW